jgi:two-component system, cell cycle response regulator
VHVRVSDRTAAYALVGLGIVMLAGYAAHAQFNIGGDTWHTFFRKWLNDAIPLTCTAICLLRARAARSDRAAWVLMGLGMAMWAAGNIWYSLYVIDLDPLPVPSIADGLWLAMYPLMYIGVAMLLRSRIRTWRTSMWLDSMIAATAVAAVSADTVVSVVLSSSSGSSTSELLTNLAYPIGDLVLMGMAVGAIALEGWRADRSWFMLAAGFAAFAVTDGLFLVRVADGTYQVGTIVDAGWLLAAVMISIAAWQPASRAQHRVVDGWRFVVMPTLFGLVALGLLVRNSSETVARPWTAAIASLTLLGVFARFAVTFREYMHMVKHSSTEAATDVLTGLGNRRRLLVDLDWAARRAATNGSVAAFGLFDLDGFKAYNDAYGHPAGDALLTRLGGRLAAAVDSAGSAYRMGGDEFCVITSCARGEAQSAIARVAAAMTETGPGFSIRASFGAVELPAETLDATDALRTADQRMYQYKQTRRAATGKEISQTLLAALTEHSPGWDAHMSAVADLAVAVAHEMGLPQDDVVDVRRAAELHDIGKIAVPAAILGKPGRLTGDEWTFVKRHTLIGERIVRAAPTLGQAARLIRSSHERWDGSGYPDQLRGNETPAGARIIVVCDSYNAMTTDRSYHAAMTRADAISELRRCAGTQFDPQVVEAFCRVQSHGNIAAAA